ncbi:galanin receptor 2a-like [Corticium candelabrum]|uniref:galanin receptor 2a-like n=1 Tax=Corticium candelabrum TaxID=121492 RepID=UPI002E269C61|nr:galanin receptor 2a-like [Corticium candelabrum]
MSSGTFFFSEYLATETLSNVSHERLSNLSNGNWYFNGTSCVFNVSRIDPIVDDFSIAYKAVIRLLYTLIAILGVVGNVSIIFVLYKNGRRRHEYPSNVCLLKVAVIDLLYFLVCHPIIMWNLLREGTWRTGDVICRINGGLNCMVYLTACYSLPLISLERQLNITYPIKLRSLSVGRVKIFSPVSGRSRSFAPFLPFLASASTSSTAIR